MRLIKVKKIIDNEDTECWINPEKIVCVDLVKRVDGVIYYLYLEDDIFFRIPEGTFNFLVNNLLEGM